MPALLLLLLLLLLLSLLLSLFLSLYLSLSLEVPPPPSTEEVDAAGDLAHRAEA